MLYVYTIYTCMMPSKGARRIRCMFVVGVLVIFVLLIIVIWLAATRNKTETVKEVKIPASAALGGYIRPKAIPTSDGLDVRWFPNAQRRSDINHAIAGSYKMLDVIMMASDDGITLDDLWDPVQTHHIGVKINVASNQEAEEVINVVKDRELDQPILISVPMLEPSQRFQWQRFKEITSKTMFTSPVTINIQIAPQCCDSSGLGHGTVEYLGFIIKDSNLSMTVEVDADLIKASWPKLKWLLDTNPNLQLIITSRSGYQASKYDLLLVRNDIDSDRVFYNIDVELLREFLDLASTAGSPFLYFGITPREGINVLWSHNTDTWELLNTATQGDVMMIEGDIMLLGQDTDNQSDIPIMAHNIGEYNNLTFEQWVDEIIKVNKGMKLDFKTIDAVRPALEIVARKKSAIKGPVWANADILKGPNSADPRISATDFLNAVQIFPNVVLSLGWKTVQKREQYNLKYTMAMVQEMYQTVKDVSLPITFPVRAEQLVESWPEFEWLLSKSRGYTLTVWTAYQDNVTKADMDFVRRKSEASRVYFDLPVDLRPTII